MFWAIVALTALIAVAILSARDRMLKRRGKAMEQIRAASEANVTSYSGIRRLAVGSLLILGGVADYIDKGSVTVRVVALLLIGLAILGFGVDSLGRAHLLEKFVDFDQS
jgi:hypothetical protein